MILSHCKDTIKKKVKHDLKILFSLFKKVSLVDDDNFLALFLCAFFIFLGHFISLPYIHFMFYGCFLIQIFSVEKGDLLLFLISAPHY